MCRNLLQADGTSLIHPLPCNLASGTVNRAAGCATGARMCIAHELISLQQCIVSILL